MAFPARVYVSALVKTLISTYPFALVVLQLPDLDATAFESCSRRAGHRSDSLRTLSE